MSRVRGGLNLGVLALSVLLTASSAAADQTSASGGDKGQQLVDAVKANRKLVTSPPPAGGWPKDIAYGYTFDGLLGGQVPLSAFRGDVVLVVNTASQCGYTPQYKGLQALYSEFKTRGLVIVGVPSNDFGGQEPGGAAEIAKFCELNYGVTFPMTAKYVVQGPQAHPFYKWAFAQVGSRARPQWNFHKILIGRDGKAISAFPSADGPDSASLRKAVIAALG